MTGRWCDIVLNAHASTENKCGDTKDSFYEELERAFDQFCKHGMKVLVGNSNGEVAMGRYFHTDCWEREFARN